MAGVKQFFLAAACVLLLVTVAMANPPLAQYGDQVDPAQNWEAVILSRNGPSTTTTPRPRTKAPQELRCVLELLRVYWILHRKLN